MRSVSSGMYRERHDSKKARFHCSGLNLGSSFMSQDEGCLNPCVDPRESRRSPPHLDRGNHITWTPREAHGIPCFKSDEALLFLKMDRNPNITIQTRK